MAHLDRITLSPPLRREIADMHARQVFRDYIQPLGGMCSYEQIAEILNTASVPPVRAKSAWDGMKVHTLLKRVRRGS